MSAYAPPVNFASFSCFSPVGKRLQKIGRWRRQSFQIDRPIPICLSNLLRVVGIRSKRDRLLAIPDAFWGLFSADEITLPEEFRCFGRVREVFLKNLFMLQICWIGEVFGSRWATFNTSAALDTFASNF